MGAQWEEVKSISDQREFALRVQEFQGKSLFSKEKKRNCHPVNLFHGQELDKRVSFFLK